MSPVTDQPRARRRGRWRRYALRLAVCSSAALLAALAAWYALPWAVPLPESLSAPPPASVLFVSQDGTPLRQLLDENGARSAQPVAYDQIPRHLIAATLAAEDKRFFSHGGVDLAAITRAVWDNATSGRVVSGASTVTQQLAKIAAEAGGNRTLKQKIIEALQARRLEMTWSKEQILTEYLNRIHYGNLFTGCSTAADGYFSKPLHDLTPAESAFLAALPQSPTRLNPFRNPDAAKTRQAYILNRMHDLGWLDDESFTLAGSQPIRLERYSGAFTAPHAVDLTRSLVAETGASNTIRTSIDARLQRQVETIVAQRLNGLESRHVTHAAVVVIENATGRVLSLVGSRDFFAADGGQINGAWTPNSPGSAIKPFTYLLAFQRGSTPATIVADLPVEFPTATGNYRPENYDLKCYGPMTCRAALGNSLNISAVKTLDTLGGPETLLEALRDAGLTTLTEPAEHYGLGLTIGNAPVRLLELANAYACLARLGIHKPWTLSAAAPATEERRLFDANCCYLIADILSDNQARTLTFGAHSPLRLPFRVAVKTGTSSTYRDNWTLGFTPEFTVGVWAGNFDNTPMENVSGVTGAAPIFRDVFTTLHERHEITWYTEPDAIVRARIDPRTGKILGPNSPMPRMSREEIFVRGHEPADARASDYAENSGAALLPRQYETWVRGRDNWLGAMVACASEKPDSRLRPLRITHPVPGTVILLDPDIRNHGNRLLLSADAAGGIEWSSPTLRMTDEGSQRLAILTPGRHEIEARIPSSGQAARTWVLVREE